MKMRTGLGRNAGFLLVALSVVAAAPGFTQAPDEQKMTPEQKAQMDAWTKAATPGKPHADLATKAGVWEGTTSMWETPGSAPQVSQGRSERKMILGGRVLVDNFTSSMMGMPFEGTGMNGYDNVTGKYWATWTDTFSTGLMKSTGTCDADEKRGCSFSGTYVDPMTGKEKKNRYVVSWPAADQEKMEMFDTGTDGKEYKSMEILLKRVKS
jgi:hypothetical protein